VRQPQLVELEWLGLRDGGLGCMQRPHRRPISHVGHLNFILGEGRAMSESLRMWAEISFDVAYLLTIWSLVALMAARRSRVEPENRKVSTWVLWAFALLAFGDTGHVGFRVVAYGLGGLESNPLLISIGGLMTSLTVTLYYVALQMAWKERFERRLGLAGGFLLLCAAVQLVVVVFAQIRWGPAMPPDSWFLLSPSYVHQK